MEFDVSKARVGPSVSFFLLSVDLDVELSSTFSAPCLPVGHHASHHFHNGLNLWNCKQALIKCLSLRESVVIIVSLQSNRTPTKTYVFNEGY